MESEMDNEVIPVPVEGQDDVTEQIEEGEQIDDGEQIEGKENLDTPESTNLENRSSEFRRRTRQSKLKTIRVPFEKLFPKIDKDEGEDMVETDMKSSSADISTAASVRFMQDLNKNITFTVTRELFVRPNKYSTSNREIKMTDDMQRPFLVFEDDIDYTPKRAIGPKDPRWVAEPMMLRFPGKPFLEVKPDDILVQGRKILKSELDTRTSAHRLNAKIESSLCEDDSNDDEGIKAPPMFPLKFPEPLKLNRMRIMFRLKETDTFVLFEMVSRASAADDDEGFVIKKINTIQETVSKRLRKKMDNYCQTCKDGRQRMKETQLSCNTRENSCTYSSVADWYDTIKALEAKSIPPPPPPRQMVGKVDKIKYGDTHSTCEPLVGNQFLIKDRLQWYRTGMIMERVLLSNNAMKRQLVFHDFLQSDPLSNEVKFKYSLNYLWTLNENKTRGTAVTSMAWNHFSDNLLAVGHGKYNFTDKSAGYVCIWNNKNLGHPERVFKFAHAVTCIRFCKTYPDILAVSFYSGWVVLINILRREGVKIIAQNMSFHQTSVTPVWDIAWLYTSEFRFENIVECRGNGDVFYYTRRHLYEKKPIMKISRVKGTVKGISHPKKCQPYVIPLVRSPDILCIAIHPTDEGIYYLGSDEGGVYKCSLQDVHQYTDMFLAHNGPVYTIKFHPACSKIFLTCGADWYVRVWGDGIYSPLLTMISGISSVQSAGWCPNNPTIIIAITDKRIELWDISRRIIFPQAVYHNPKNILNTSLEFSKCGNNVCIGDKDGYIHVYALSNMPFPPTNPDMVLALILIKALTPHRKLLNELYKLGPPFNVSRIYKSYLNLS